MCDLDERLQIIGRIDKFYFFMCNYFITLIYNVNLIRIFYYDRLLIILLQFKLTCFTFMKEPVIWLPVVWKSVHEIPCIILNLSTQARYCSLPIIREFVRYCQSFNNTFKFCRHTFKIDTYLTFYIEKTTF